MRKWLLEHTAEIILVTLALLVLGVTAAMVFNSLSHLPRQPTVLHTTTVDTVYKDKPVIRDRIIDRIIYKTLPAETVLVSLPGTVDTLVQRFCDTSSSKPARLVLTGGRTTRTNLYLFGFTSHGSAYRGEWRADAPYEFSTSGDSVRVRQSRIRFNLPGFALGLAKYAAIGATGYLAGRAH